LDGFRFAMNIAVPSELDFQHGKRINVRPWGSSQSVSFELDTV
jgi:hypothetical protein